MTSPEQVAPLRQRPAWAALERHHAEIGERHLRDLFAEDPDRGERLRAEAVGLYLDYSKNRVTDETMRLLLQLAEESHLEERRDMMFRGEHINVSEDRAVLHVALRMPRDATPRRRRGRRGGRGPRRPRPDGGLLRPDPLGRVEGPHGQADQERHQRRHRRLRPRTGHGLRGAAALQPQGHDVPLRVERRLDGLRGGHPRPLRGRDALHHLVQDVRDAGDAHQRARRPATGSSASWATRPRWRSTSSPCPRTRSGWRRSGSTPPTCSGSGTGSAVATRWTRPSASRR